MTYAELVPNAPDATAIGLGIMLAVALLIWRLTRR